MANLLLDEVRGGVTDPLLIVGHVTTTCRQALLRAGRDGRDDAEKWREYLNALTEHSDEATDLAGYYVTYDSMPPGQREQIKSERSEFYQRESMRGQPATRAQLAYLVKLGCPETELPTDKADASALIDERLRVARR